MKFSKRGWLLSLGLWTLCVRNTSSGQDPDRLHFPSQDSAALDASKVTASDQTTPTSADGLGSDQKEPSDETRSDTNENANTDEPVTGSEKAESTPDNDVIVDKTAATVVQDLQIEGDKNGLNELHQHIKDELTIVNEVSRPTSDRVSAIEVLGSLAVSHADLQVEGDTVASYVVRNLLPLSHGSSVSIAKYSILRDILCVSGKSVVAGNKGAHKLAIEELYRSIQKDDRRIQLVSSSALADVLTNISVDKEDFSKNEFDEVVRNVSGAIATHPESNIRLGLLTALAQKGNAILKQELDVASAIEANAKAFELKQKLDAAESEAVAARTAHDAATAAQGTSASGVGLKRKAIAEKDTEIANERVTLEDLIAPGSGATAQDITDQKKKIEDFERQLDVLNRALALLKTADDNAIASLGTALDTKNAKDSAKSAAKTAYDAAKADATAKSKVKPVAETALPTVLSALRELSSSAMPVDRVRVEARYALTKFLKAELLPGDENLKFTPGPMPTDRQPLAASDRPTAGMMNSERMGVTHTRSFNSALDVTNRPTRGSRVSAPPVSLRIPGPDAEFSTDPPEVKKAAGATKVKVDAFVPGTMPKAATPAAGIRMPPSSTSGGSTSDGSSSGTSGTSSTSLSESLSGSLSVRSCLK